MNIFRNYNFNKKTYGFLTIFIVMFACKKQDDVTILPTITLNKITHLTTNSVSCFANIRNFENNKIMELGICWDTTPNPDIEHHKTIFNGNYRTFTVELTDLTTNTRYYIKAFATSEKETMYSNELTFKTFNDSLIDIEGNVYYTIAIGNQIWMVENLKTTKFNDGTDIPNVIDVTEWSNLKTPSYCWYNNNSDVEGKVYGALYNWFAATSGKLAPRGWHIPSDAEWQVLVEYLGGDKIAGGKLKESGTDHWTVPNAAATNESGFSALPGGTRHGLGRYYYIGIYGSWWSTDAYNEGLAWYRGLDCHYGFVLKYSVEKNDGFSIRCLKD